MHPFIAGQLAEARMSDIDREVAEDAIRAYARAARRTRPSRREALMSTLRRAATAWVSP